MHSFITRGKTYSDDYGGDIGISPRYSIIGISAKELMLNKTKNTTAPSEINISLIGAATPTTRNSTIYDDGDKNKTGEIEQIRSIK